MTARDLFYLAVLLVGLLFLYHGLTSAIDLVRALLTGNFPAMLIDVISAFLELFLARWFFESGARMIIDMAFPAKSE